MNWWAVDQMERTAQGWIAVMVPAWFETATAGRETIWAKKGMAVGQVWRAGPRGLTRDRAYERRAAAAARAAQGALRR